MSREKPSTGATPAGRRGVLMGYPSMNPNVLQAAQALAEAHLLAEFHTGLNLTRIARLPLGRVSEQARRRSLPPDVQQVARSHGAGEGVRLLLERQRVVGHNPVAGAFSSHALHAAMARRLASRIRHGGFRAVYAYDDGALEAFVAARNVGARAILDLPTAYWGARLELLRDEAESTPAWASTIDALDDSPQHLERKDLELRSADSIIVASTFAANTLTSAPLPQNATVTIANYGVHTGPAPLPERPSGAALRVLFVGRLSQEKGLSYLFNAIEMLGSAVELTVIGDGRDLDNRALSGALGRASWRRSAPRHVVLRDMAAHDVLVLPSISDAFGLVLTEALSVGTPFIASTNTGGPDLLAAAPTSGAPAGWIVPVRDAGAIASRLQMLVDDEELRRASRESAHALALEFEWSRYRDAIRTAVARELGR